MQRTPRRFGNESPHVIDLVIQLVIQLPSEVRPAHAWGQPRRSSYLVAAKEENRSGRNFTATDEGQLRPNYGDGS
jgi:hypothetical protein